MSYFKVGEPYYKIGDWVNIILPEYDSKTIWKIIEIEFSPGELPIVKLKNVFYYDETVETTIDNIRPVQYLKKQNNKIEIKTVNNPRLEALKKIFPDYYNSLIRGILFDKTKTEEEKMSAKNNEFNIGDLVRVIHGNIYQLNKTYKIIEMEIEPGMDIIVKLQNVNHFYDIFTTSIENIEHERDIVYYASYTDLRDNTLDEHKLIAKPFTFNWVKNPYELYADFCNTNLKNNLKHIIDMSYDKIREESEGERDMYYLACDIKTKNTVACYTNIKKVIFNDPATIIFWKDGSKTVVKCGPDEKYDPEKGMAMAIAKRVYGTSETGGNYYNIFKKWLPEEKTLKDSLEPTTNNDLVPTFINKEDTLDVIRSIGEGLSQLNKEANIDVTDWNWNSIK